MARFGFVGPSYTSQSPFLNAERTVNWYVEKDETGDGKSAAALYPSPGLSTFSTPYTRGPVWGSIAVNGRLFVVVDKGSDTGGLFEISSDGTATSRGTVDILGTNNVSLSAGNDYLFIVTDDEAAYAFKLSTNTFTDVTSSLDKSTPLMGAFLDGYYIVLFKDSNTFQISSLEDPTTWSSTDVAQVSVFGENVTSMLVDHRELWMFGAQHTQVYYNDGASGFPFSVIPGAFMEQGCCAAFSPVRMDNSVFWIGGDERGQGIAWRANGYVPQRISNHAVEYAWSQYSDITDAVSYSFQDQGHTFWHIYFPTAGASWRFDAATNQWHEVQSDSGAHYSQCHAFCFGKHLIGSRETSTGKVYEMSSTYTDDDGTDITRIRRAPWVSVEGEWMFHSRLQIDLEPGLATGTDNPQVTLKWSDDGTKSWSSDHTYSAGKSGVYTQRVIARRLGRSLGRIYELSVSDSIPWRIVDAYLQATPVYNRAVPRLSKYYGQAK